MCCAGGGVVRTLLLLCVALHLNTALSWRAGGRGKLVRDSLHRLMGEQRHHLDRWVRVAACGGALLSLACLPPVQSAGIASSGARGAAGGEGQVPPMLRSETGMDVGAELLHTTRWSIAVTAKGKIAHMHVRVQEEEGVLSVAGYLAPTLKGGKYLDPEPVRFYLADENYVTHDGLYNGFTMPLRLSWLASERRRVLTRIAEVLSAVAASERALVELGSSMYRGFARLHVADSDGYGFDNLATQTEVKFAGLRFFDYRAVREAIAHRHLILPNKRIAHKQRLRGVQLDQEVLNTADAAYRAVLALRQSSAVKLLQLNLAPRAAADADFSVLVENLARLKLARLLLAHDILAFYEPFTMPFFYSAGVQEHLNLTIYVDDSKRGDVALRYESRTTSRKHKKEFTLGKVDFDHHLHIKKMWMSLKPRGGLTGFAKLTFTPCVAEECPEPDFAQ